MDLNVERCLVKAASNEKIAVLVVRRSVLVVVQKSGRVPLLSSADKPSSHDQGLSLLLCASVALTCLVNSLPCAVGRSAQSRFFAAVTAMSKDPPSCPRTRIGCLSKAPGRGRHRDRLCVAMFCEDMKQLSRPQTGTASTL